MSNMWMRSAGPEVENAMTVYRCRFHCEAPETIRFDFSADEVCTLFLDGEELSKRQELGSSHRYYFKTVEFTAAPGRHVLTARVFSFAYELRACQMMSVRHGFFLRDRSGKLTGWDCQIAPGISFEAPFPDWGVYPRVRIHADYNGGIEAGQGGEWREVQYFEDDRELFPPDLPPMSMEKTVPEKKSDTLYYFREYVLAWASYTFTGKGRVRLRWAETPYLVPGNKDSRLKDAKGNRDGQYFLGNYDEFEVDGKLVWRDYQWRAGHYLELEKDPGVEVECSFEKTHYPYPDITFENPLRRAAFATLQCCSADTFMDCPYYERLMYIGDSRIEALCVYSITDDHRLPEKALKMILSSQREDGSICSRFPSKNEQVIPSFMLIYILMFHDYYKIHGRNRLVLELLPRVDRLMAYLRSHMKDGLLYLPGWNFIDWCDEWGTEGVPPRGAETNCPLNLFMVLALRKMAEIKSDPELEDAALTLEKNVFARYYDEKSGLLANDFEKQDFSEHAQILALLADSAAPVGNFVNRTDLVPCGIYFSFYYLSVCREHHFTDLFNKRYAKYQELLSRNLTTLPEEFEAPRSDCHAWSSHVMLFEPL